MSRTYKDKPSRLTYVNPWFYNDITGIWSRTVNQKQKKRKDTKYHWMSTPSWWTRLTMNRPQRMKLNRQLRVLPDCLEDVDVAWTKNKPHEYYY